MTASTRTTGRAALTWMLVSAAVCVGVPCWQLLGYQPYQFGISMPQTWQGGIEAVVVASLLSLAQTIARRGARIAVTLLIAELYLRRFGADVPFLIDIAYFEIVVGIGYAITRLAGVRREQRIEDYLRWFMLGVCGWSVCAWTLSAMGAGSVRDLRWLTLALGIAVLFARPRPLSLYLIARTDRMPLAARIVIALIGAWLLVLLAKTNTAMNFDALWYSVRGQYALVGEGSAFRSAGLVSPVYYFPKLFELMLIPVSGLGNATATAGLSVLVLGMLALACDVLLQRLRVTSIAMRLAIVFACISLPAVSNSAVDPKPELLAAFMIVFAWIYADEFLRTRNVEALLWSSAGLILSTQAKLVAIPFAAVLAVAVLLLAVRRRRAEPAPVAIAGSRDHTGKVAALLTLLVALLITARTFLLTGMPTVGPDALVHVWEKLGFHFRFPTGTMAWMKAPDWADAPALAFDALFRPQEVPHFITYWTGNIWLWAICLVPLMARVARRDDDRAQPLLWIGTALGACGVVLLFGISYYVRGGDGNYFIVAIVAASVLSLAAVERRLTPTTRVAFGTALAAFTLFQIAFAFVSADWMAGTRSFDFDFKRNFKTFHNYNKSLLSANGLLAIDQHLKKLHRVARVVGCMDDNLDMRLHARAESIQQIAYARIDFYANATAFRDFLQDDKIDFLIAPRNGNSAAECYDIAAVREVIAAFDNDERITKIPDTGYVMYDLSRWSASRVHGAAQ